MAAGQRGVATERNLLGRREPAQFVIGLFAAVGKVKGGFGEIIFLGNGLQDIIFQPCFERHDRCLIAGKGAVGEGVDMKIGQICHG